VGAENISFTVYEHLKKELASAMFIDVTQEIFIIEKSQVRNCFLFN
jgi:hypothetical protein